MRLSALAAGYEINGDTDPEVSGISEDSRRITPGMLFVAVRGTIDDGHRYVGDAARRGAVAVLCEAAVDTGGLAAGRVPSGPTRRPGPRARSRRAR